MRPAREHEEVLDHSEITDVAHGRAELFADFALDGLRARLAEFNAAAERAQEPGARDRVPAFVQEDPASARKDANRDGTNCGRSIHSKGQSDS